MWKRCKRTGLLVMLVAAGIALLQGAGCGRKPSAMPLEAGMEDGGFAGMDILENTAGKEAEYEIENILPEISVRFGSLSQNTYKTSGRGVILGEIDGKIWAATAGHVVEAALAEDMDPGYGLWAGLEGKAGVLTYLACEKCQAAEDADVAFLVLDKAKAREALESVGVVGEITAAAFPNKDNYDMLAQGDAVHVTEYKDGKESFIWGTMTEPWIYVEDFGQYMMLAECRVAAGMSGCGLYDGGDRLLGIVCGMNESGQVAAVPLHMVIARWEDASGTPCP